MEIDIDLKVKLGKAWAIASDFLDTSEIQTFRPLLGLTNTGTKTLAIYGIRMSVEAHTFIRFLKNPGVSGGGIITPHNVFFSNNTSAPFSVRTQNKITPLVFASSTVVGQIQTDGAPPLGLTQFRLAPGNSFGVSTRSFGDQLIGLTAFVVED